MTVLLSGGAKNGKSYHAQRISKALSRGAPLYYIATMIPHDSEDDARTARHLREREGWGFETLECPLQLLRCLEASDPRGTYLLDSVTALLSNEMFSPSGEIDRGAPERVAGDLTEFAHRAANAVFVSDFIYSDAMLYDETTEAYRKGLALCDAALARCCDAVIEVSGGMMTAHKGVLL